MEGESGLESSSESVRWLTFAELSDELCPQYMSIGVSFQEYWHGDYTQLAYYAKAFEVQRERANYDAWLQGAYVYDAFCFASPLLHAFAKKGTTPLPYHKEPYGAAQDGDKPTAGAPKTEKEIQEIQAHNASARFASFMTQWNKQHESKGGEADVNDDRRTAN